MNSLTKKVIITFVAAIGSSTVLAENITWPPAYPAGENLSRQEVQQARAEFMKNPVVNGWRYIGGEPGWELLPVNGPEEKTHAQVLDELVAYQGDPQQQQRHLRFYHSGR